MPNYTKYGKLEDPITKKEFIEGMERGKFLNLRQKAYPILLYYTAVRKTEALRSTRDEFTITKNKIIWDVGPRLKKLRHKQKGKILTQSEYEELLRLRRRQLSTPPLSLPLNAPYIDVLKEVLLQTPKGVKVWPYCPKTAYNIVARTFKYPHFFRLSRITNFFLDGWTIPQVRSWTGLSLAALNYYVGVVDIKKMGESLGVNDEKKS